MKILVISSNLIGDNILSTGIIRDFIDRYPNSNLTVIVGPSAAQVYESFPNIHKVIIIKKQKFEFHWFKIWKKCFFSKWDIVIDFRSSLISYFLFKKKSYVFIHSKNTHKISQLNNFFTPKNNATPIIYNNAFEKNIAENKLLSDKIYIVVSPGGNWPPKIWPVEYFNHLLKILLEHDNRFVILVGSNKEKNRFKQKLIKNINEDKIIDLMGSTITQTYAFMKRSNLFIGNDSGMMHLAAASKIPTIGLFGPTNDLIYSPFGKKCYVVRTKENYKDFKYINIDPSKSYMRSIKVQDIINIIEEKKLI